MPPIQRISALRNQLRHSAIPRLPQLLHAPNSRWNSTASAGEAVAKSRKAEKKPWLLKKAEKSSAVEKLVKGAAALMGYDTTKQHVGRRAHDLYKVCAAQPDADKRFWIEDCAMPANFQTWFTITNLHIWMLTVRLRALPDPYGGYFTQSILDHFFMDIDDRLRDIYQPLSPEKMTTKKHYTFRSNFYVNPHERGLEVNGKKVLVRAPDRILSKEMKIFKEQWAGMGMSMDLALVRGDQEMAATLWRNILGARGAKGIVYPSADGSAAPKFRRHLNLVGGEVVKLTKLDIEAEEAKDDGSGVHDFPPAEVDKYLEYPQLMLDMVGYVRREIARLEDVPFADIIGDSGPKILRFGKVERVQL